MYLFAACAQFHQTGNLLAKWNIIQIASTVILSMCMLLTCCPVYLRPSRLTFHSMRSWNCSSCPPQIRTTKQDTEVSRRSGSMPKSRLRQVGFWQTHIYTHTREDWQYISTKLLLIQTVKENTNHFECEEFELKPEIKCGVPLSNSIS